MAGAEFEIRADVSWALPLSLHVVMAGRATPVRLRMVEVDSRYPGDRCMAAFAAFRRQDVIRRFRCRANAAHRDSRSTLGCQASQLPSA